ncbi:MAG: YceI family protein [Agriterribacter sp.]
MKLYLFLALVAISAAIKWNADSEKAAIKFTVDGPFGTVNGSFSGLKADIKFSADDLAGSSFTASIDPATVSTGVGLRNRDLRKEETWFNTEKYPLISFKSTKVEKKGNGYVAIGELTMKGKSKTIEIPFTFTEQGNTGEFKGDFVIKREDFGLGKHGGSVGNEVSLNITVPVKK